MNVVHDTGALELQRKNVHDLEGALNATHSQRVIGTLTKTDEAQAQASLVAARTALAAAEAQLANSRTTFMRIVGRPAETLEDAPALPAVPKSVDEAVAIALKQNPALIAAQQNVKAADHAVDSADGALLPQISITGTYQYSKDNPDSPFANLATNKYAAVLGQITIPIYQGGGEYATIRQNEELRNKLRLTADEVYREVDDVTRSTWQNLFEAQTAIANGKAQVAANELANEGVTEEQRAGERTVLDTLNAKQALVNAQLALLDATRNSYEATYGLLSAMGQLTAKQQGLNVQLYDPITHYKQDAASWFGWSD